MNLESLVNQVHKIAQVVEERNIMKNEKEKEGECVPKYLYVKPL
jgi:hypothetical protein